MQGQINTWGSPTCAASRFNSALVVCRLYNFHHQVVNDDRVGLDPWWCDGRGRDFSKWFKTRLALTRQPSRMKLTFEEERKLLLEDELGAF